jgi:hypothetical protein
MKTKMDGQLTGQVPTVAGAVPACMDMRRVEVATAANNAEFQRLPRAGERCPVSGASRSWLIETDAKLPPDERFLVRVRRRGCLRGAVFISVPRLTAFIYGVRAGTVPGFTAEASEGKEVA